MSNIAVIAKITAQPGKRADVVAGMASMMDHVESEAGTVEVHLAEDQATPTCCGCTRSTPTRRRSTATAAATR